MKPHNQVNENIIWKAAKGYEGQYEVSNFGGIRGIDRVVQQKNKWGGISKVKIKGRERMPQNGSSGYHIVTLKGKSKLLHRIIAQTFIPNPYNLREVNHIDGNKKNNIISNLEWVSREQNIRHGYDTGLIRQSSGSSVSITIQRGEEVHQFKNQIEAAKFMGVSREWVSGAKIGGYFCNGWKVYGIKRNRTKKPKAA